MIFIILFLINSFSFCSEYSIQYDTFANFAKSTNRVYTTSTAFNCISEIHITGSNVILKAGVESHQFVKLNNSGEEIATLTPGLGYENRFEGHPVYWEPSCFVTVGGSTIKKYDYNFDLVTSFGTNGAAQLTIEGSSIQLTTIIKEGNYYYVGGYKLTENPDYSFTIIARFTLDGTLDGAFNSSNTPGYIILNMINAAWGPHQMVIVDNHIIAKTSNNVLISLSLENESAITLANTIGLAETCSIAPDDSGKSFYAYQADLNNSYIPTLFKYTASLQLDTSLNSTGKYVIDFMSINSELSSNSISTLKTINHQLFLLGGYPSSRTQGPFIICLSMKNKVPVLNSSFLGTGYFIGSPSDYPQAGGTFDMIFSETTLSSLFFSCGRHITKIPLGEEFVQTNGIIPMNINARLEFYRAHGKKIPFLI